MSRTDPVLFTPTRWLKIAALAPYAPWLERFDEEERQQCWPEVSTLRARLGSSLSFWIPPKRLPVGIDDSDIHRSYIGHCVQGAVPTRANNLHDFLNALTWARFPLAKAALCQRYFDLALARGRKTDRLRNPAQDFLSMIDEGGVLHTPSGETLVFGHGLLEDEVRGRISRGLTVEVSSLDDGVVSQELRRIALPDRRGLVA